MRMKDEPWLVAFGYRHPNARAQSSKMIIIYAFALPYECVREQYRKVRAADAIR